MPKYSANDLRIATNGFIKEEIEASAISIDSRTIKPGEIFIAIKGDNFDGHDYVEAAMQKGAACAIISREIFGENNLLVADTFQALKNLATYNRARFSGKVIGITGSVGKTSTKEAIAALLANFGSIYASKGNFNNHYGVPLSLANMDLDADYAIFEMGMNHAGEISDLTHQVKPDIALITTVEAVHLENFPSLLGIADAKAEIFEALSDDGIAIINADNQFFEYLTSKTDKKTLSFGENKNADFRLISYDQGNLEIAYNGNKYHYHVQVPGKHNALNSLAVIAMAVAVGVDPADTALHIGHAYQAKDGRGKIHQINDIRLIDDCYNASPVSMKAAIEILGQFEGRKIAIMGDMKELGKDEITFHKSLIDVIEQQKIDKIIAVGKLMRHLFDILPEEKKLSTYDDYSQIDLGFIKPNDNILVKGSHSMKLEKVVERILNHG